jgi:glycosyltransferase involved in cell wall biosynthesis
MISQSYYPRLGGAELQLAALIPLLRERGVEIHIITRRYAGLVPYELIGGVPVYRIAIPGPKPIAALAFILGALPLIGRLKPDVIHAHELLSPSLLALIAKRLFGIPVVAKVLRGGKLGDIDKLRQRRFGMRRLAGLRDQMDVFIMISTEIEQELDEIGVPREKRIFIPNGVDTERFIPLPVDRQMDLRERLGLPRSALVTIYAGRLVAEKRVDHLLAVWPGIREKFPEAELVVLGTGKEQARLTVNLPQGVRLLGLVDDVAPYLQSADVFALPSSTEGLSNALLEALGTGLAVVATAVGGAPDVINHGENGLLIPPDNLPALRIALETVLGDAALRRMFGKAGRKTILEHYSLHQTADALAALYTHLAIRQ